MLDTETMDAVVDVLRELCFKYAKESVPYLSPGLWLALDAVKKMSDVERPNE